MSYLLHRNTETEDNIYLKRPLTLSWVALYTWLYTTQITHQSVRRKARSFRLKITKKWMAYIDFSSILKVLGSIFLVLLVVLILNSRLSSQLGQSGNKQLTMQEEPFELVGHKLSSLNIFWKASLIFLKKPFKT